jgi:hypothetical protein
MRWVLKREPKSRHSPRVANNWRSECANYPSSRRFTRGALKSQSRPFRFYRGDPMQPRERGFSRSADTKSPPGSRLRRQTNANAASTSQVDCVGRKSAHSSRDGESIVALSFWTAVLVETPSDFGIERRTTDASGACWTGWRASSLRAAGASKPCIANRHQRDVSTIERDARARPNKSTPMRVCFGDILRADSKRK